MNPDPSIETEICRYLEEDLDPNEQAEFEARLLEDAEAADLLCMHALIGVSMRQSAAFHDDTAQRLLERQKRKAVKISLAAAAAIAIGLGLVLHQIMVPDPERVAIIDSAPGTVFSIQGTSPEDQDGKLQLGETLVVSQGTAQLTLADGSRCVAEAPARITLHEEARAHLSNGRAFFEIAKGSEGFVVTTRDLEIVDLGTAFGVDDRADHQPQVHVIRGSVRASALSGRRESCELVEGEAVAVGAAGRLRPIASDGAAFFEHLPKGLPSIRFGFEAAEDGTLTASGTIADQQGVRFIHRTGASFEPLQSDELREGILKFQNRAGYLQTTWPGIGGSVPRTISLWVRIPEGTEDGSILGWGLPSGSRQMSDLRITYSGDALANLRLSSGRRWLQTTQRLDTGRWHHVAFLLDSPVANRWPTVKCYVDGVPESVTPRVPEEGEAAPLLSFETIINHPKSRPLTFGCQNPEANQNAFTGEIDEVVISAGILTEKEVISLSKTLR